MNDVRLSHADGCYTITTPCYRLFTRADRPFVVLETPEQHPIAELFIASSVHTTTGQDDTTWLGSWSAAPCEGGVTLTLVAGSSVWEEKIYCLHCLAGRLRYEVTVAGAGRLADLHLFGGYCSGLLRWGSGFFPSGQHFLQGFTPEPNTDELPTFAPAESAVIDMVGVPLPGRGDWFFTPPPFCFAMQHQAGWLGLGVEARAGEQLFSEYRYNGRRGAFSLSLAYEGQTQVVGRTTLPAIGLDFAAGPYEALAAHCHAAREMSGTHTDLHKVTLKPNWWRMPIFCGWGAQCHLATVAHGRPADYARQEHYEGFLATLERDELSPGIVVLDDKWQASYGENEVDIHKWPDLPGFIREQHRSGRQVLLWLKLWDPEGLPVEECICNAAGKPIAADPTNPRFAQRLRASVQQMLGAGGYDADGFKIDFSARIPSGPGLRRHGYEWGLELMKSYLGLIYSEAKRVKPDALVVTHTPHPYLADVTDMIRLNDVNIGKEIVGAMTHRARVATIACPGALIDTDNWPCGDRASWRAYLRHQASLGVPSLYYVDHIDTTGELLEAEDYALLREVWGGNRVPA